MMTGARGNNTATAVASTSPALRQHDYDDGIGGSTVPEAMETALAYAMGNGTAMARRRQHRRHAAVATVMETAPAYAMGNGTATAAAAARLRWQHRRHAYGSVGDGDGGDGEDGDGGGNGAGSELGQQRWQPRGR